MPIGADTVVAVEWSPFISLSMGDSTLAMNNRSGNGYGRYSPATAKMLTTTPAAGVALPSEANCMILSVETNPIRFRTDGTNPTNAEGTLMPVGVWFFENQRAWMEQFRFIDSAAGASSVTIAYGITPGR